MSDGKEPKINDPRKPLSQRSWADVRYQLNTMQKELSKSFRRARYLPEKIKYFLKYVSEKKRSNIFNALFQMLSKYCALNITLVFLTYC